MKIGQEQCNSWSPTYILRLLKGKEICTLHGGSMTDINRTNLLCHTGNQILVDGCHAT